MPSMHNSNSKLDKAGPVKTAQRYELGQSPEMDAWLTSFYIENHLDYYTYPDHAATDEQVRFMVYTDDDERYYPCSDEMYEAIISRKKSAYLQLHYHRALKNILDLIERQIEDPYEKSYLISLMANKHKHETRDEIMIPSRVEKRLMSIYLKRTQIEDPFLAEKTQRNEKASEILKSQAFIDALNHVDKRQLVDPPESLMEIKSLIARAEFERRLCLANTPELWRQDNGGSYSKKDFLQFFKQPFQGNGFTPLLDFIGFGKLPFNKRRVLWLADEAGEVVFDLDVIRFLVSHGHKVILAFKQGPLYTKTTMADILNDPVLQEAMSTAAIIDQADMSKNELVRTLRGDVSMLALSDGSSENLNLLLSSTTFARVFKEVDVVISRGLDQRRRLFDTHFQFTQDIYNISRENDGAIVIRFKPRHNDVIKFSHHDLEAKAQTIIDQMKAAKAKGMTVIFYSGIIGSIPGKIKMAKQIMSTFVRHLTEQSALTFIINPSDYYEPGMDADDLMYMWEIVQRSGKIDIWRFQSYDDIVHAFKIMDRKIPPEWVGKDATYSTGCTKEMEIAINVQKQHPEMQLIGPAKEHFMRRKEYGVGKMYDRRLSDRR
ncbi:MAG: ARMT1-like domain-containing protein [Desulfobacteraceae bacterium]